MTDLSLPHVQQRLVEELERTDTSPLGVEVTVENVGDRAGHDVVQLYTAAETPTLARPVQKLTGFQRVHLDPGEDRRVRFDVDATRLAYHDTDMDLVVEEGAYEVPVGRSSEDIVARESFDVTETKQVPRSGRTYFTETDVESA